MLELGTVVGGKYCLEEPIGKGGMATIWRAVHMDLDRPVAVKFLDAGSGASEIARERFLREARVAASVRHRYVVDTIDFGLTDDGQAYIVMELLEGESLADRLFEGEPVHVSQLIAIMMSALKGLAAIHAVKIVHRDLKPENIFLVRDRDGSVFPKLVDFGISRAAVDSAVVLRPSKVTREGMIIGTPHYMSPEQARGLANIDHRTDIYSVGVMLYEALTGRLPFDEENPGDLLVKIMSGVARPVATFRPDLGQPLSNVIERAMARDREARYQTADALREALAVAVEKTAEVATAWGQAVTPGYVGKEGHPTPSIRPPAHPLSAHGKRKDQRGISTVSGSPPPAVRELPHEDRTKTSPPPRSSRTATWVAVGAVLVATTAVAVLATQDGDGSATRADAPRDPEPAQADSPTEHETIHVSLTRVPAGAEVRVDGRLTEGSDFELEREDRTHQIVVTAEGYRSWRVEHRATAGRTYEVALEPELEPAHAEEPPTSPTSGPTARATMRATTASVATMRATPTTMERGMRTVSMEPDTTAFRDPGF